MWDNSGHILWPYDDQDEPDTNDNFDLNYSEEKLTREESRNKKNDYDN